MPFFTTVRLDELTVLAGMSWVGGQCLEVAGSRYQDKVGFHDRYALVRYTGSASKEFCSALTASFAVTTFLNSAWVNIFDDVESHLAARIAASSVFFLSYRVLFRTSM